MIAVAEEEATATDGAVIADSTDGAAPSPRREATNISEVRTSGPQEVTPIELKNTKTNTKRQRSPSCAPGADGQGDSVTKKSKKKINVWTKTTSRKTGKKSGPRNVGLRPSDTKDDNVLLKPFHQEDDPSYPILLSKIHKAEKIELTADRLGASGNKGYRMVRATRGVFEGAWYFEIFVDRLEPTGHTRLGWSTKRGDIQAPVGYDAHSYGYRDVDGSKIHSAIREPYGQAYGEKDCIGFYINLPREPGYIHKSEEEIVSYKGQPYIVVAERPLEPVPGSEILLFMNGVSQGVAFKDINDGTYFPAASMYTLPTQDFCKVVFNFGPDFKCPPTDLGDRPLPSPMCNAPGPGEVRVDQTTNCQNEVTAAVDDTTGNQRMGPEAAAVGVLEEEKAKEGMKNEKVSKSLVKGPPVKKEKVPKVLGGKSLLTPVMTLKSLDNPSNFEAGDNAELKKIQKGEQMKKSKPQVKTTTVGPPAKTKKIWKKPRIEGMNVDVVVVEPCL